MIDISEDRETGILTLSINAPEPKFAEVNQTLMENWMRIKENKIRLKLVMQNSLLWKELWIPKRN